MDSQRDIDDRNDAPRHAANEAFVRLFAQNNQRIFAYIMAFLHNRADADEVFQETSLILWREFHRYDAAREFLPWALGISLNQIRKFRRQRKSDKLLFSDAFYDELASDSVRMAGEFDDRQLALADCMKRLEDSDRQLLELYYGAKTNARRVADAMNKSVHVVYKSLTRVRLSLFRCLERHQSRDRGA